MLRRLATVFDLTDVCLVLGLGLVGWGLMHLWSLPAAAVVVGLVVVWLAVYPPPPPGVRWSARGRDQ